MAESNMIEYRKTSDVLKDTERIVDAAKNRAYRSVNVILVQRNWLIGRRIAEEELTQNGRAEYGLAVIKSLSKSLTKKYGNGFTKTNLYNFYSFYKEYPEIFHSVSGKSDRLLSWTHYRVLLQVKDRRARDWYEHEAFQEGWSVRTLQQNVSSQYYYRMLKTQQPEAVKQEMQMLTSSYQTKLEFIKNPVIAEFLGMHEDTSYLESDLE